MDVPSSFQQWSFSRLPVFARSYRLGFVVNVLSLCVLMFSLFVTPLTETVVACAALFPWEQPSSFKQVFASRGLLALQCVSSRVVS